MRWLGITFTLAFSGFCVAQEPRALVERSQPIPPVFTSAKEAKQPTTADKEAVRKMAAEWVKRRATAAKWKASGFNFVGEFTGSPADNIQRAKYAVYRMTFEKSPEVGRERQADMLFYASGKQLVWPPEQWSRERPPPGQMNAAIRINTTDALR